MTVPVAVPVDSVSVDGVSVGTQYQLIQYQKISTSGFSTSGSVPVIPKPQRVWRVVDKVYDSEVILFEFMCRTKCGSLEFYDKSYDRVNVKNERPLQPVDRIFHTVTTSDDPVIRRVGSDKMDFVEI
jgi:hypothetical protein